MTTPTAAEALSDAIDTICAGRLNGAQPDDAPAILAALAAAGFVVVPRDKIEEAATRLAVSGHASDTDLAYDLRSLLAASAADS